MADHYIIPAHLEPVLSIILKPTYQMYEQMLLMSDEELAATMEGMVESESFSKLFGEEKAAEVDQNVEIHEALTGHRISLQKICDDLKEVCRILDKG